MKIPKILEKIDLVNLRGERGSNPHIQIMSLTSYQLLNLPLVKNYLNFNEQDAKNRLDKHKTKPKKHKLAKTK
jgi:hypothetical protein